MKIQDKRENNSILLDEHGLLCREYLPYEGEYSPKQLKIINSGMFLTKDNWENVEAAIGEFTYTDPATGDEKTVYGVLAQALIAPLVLTSDIGVFNEDGTVNIDKNGLTIVDTGTGANSTKFRLKRRQGDGTVLDVIYFDSNGNAHFAGTLDAASGTFAGELRAATGTFTGSLDVTNSNSTVKINTSTTKPIESSYTDNGKTTTFSVTGGHIMIKDGANDFEAGPDFLSIYSSDGQAYISSNELVLFDSGEVAPWFNLVYTGTRPSLEMAGNCQISGDFTVLGTKSRLVSTDQYSDRLLYCYETPSPVFGDIGEGQIGEDGICYIWIDPVFAEIIGTSQYQVFVQQYGSGTCYVKERASNYFVVKGDPGASFAWELKAKQRGYDQRRLERVDSAYTPQKVDYGANAIDHIKTIREERDTV